MDNEKIFATIDEIEKTFGFSRETFYNRIKNKEISKIRVGHKYKYNLNDLKKILGYDPIDKNFEICKADYIQNLKMLAFCHFSRYFNIDNYSIHTKILNNDLDLQSIQDFSDKALLNNIISLYFFSKLEDFDYGIEFFKSKFYYYSSSKKNDNKIIDLKLTAQLIAIEFFIIQYRLGKYNDIKNAQDHSDIHDLRSLLRQYFR